MIKKKGRTQCHIDSSRVVLHFNASTDNRNTLKLYYRGNLSQEKKLMGCKFVDHTIFHCKAWNISKINLSKEYQILAINKNGNKSWRVSPLKILYNCYDSHSIASLAAYWSGKMLTIEWSRNDYDVEYFKPRYKVVIRGENVEKSRICKKETSAEIFNMHPCDINSICVNTTYTNVKMKSSTCIQIKHNMCALAELDKNEEFEFIALSGLIFLGLVLVVILMLLISLGVWKMRLKKALSGDNKKLSENTQTGEDMDSMSMIQTTI